MPSWPFRPHEVVRREHAPAREIVRAPIAGGANAPAQDSRARSRGQSMVEFALVLPIMLVLLLVAVDFGRVYLGYINVQNMARIAANEAATNPDAWAGTGDATAQATYRRQVLEDAQAINCALPLSGETLDASVNPTFNGTAVGDTATVRITCDFGVITPLISDIVGGTIRVGGEATFPVRTGMIVNGTATGAGVEKPAADFYAEDTSVLEGSPVQLRYSGGGGTPTSFAWVFKDEAGNVVGTSTAQDPGVAPDPPVVFATKGNYTVAVTVTNAGGSDSETKVGYIVVLPSTSVAFSGTPLNGATPLAVKFLDESADAVEWSWSFGDGNSSTEKSPTHLYTGAGKYDVTLEIKDSEGGTASLKRTAYVSVSAGLCRVPNFLDVWSYDAQAKWAAAGFTSMVQFQSQDLPWPVKSQTITGTSDVPCDSTITLKKN